MVSAALLLLSGVPAKAATGASEDPFIGDWLLAMHSAAGQSVSGYEMTVALKVSLKGNFYDVVLEIPVDYPETEYGGFSWVKFAAQSRKSLSSLTAGRAKRKYTGEYLPDIGGESITHQNGGATFNYKAQNGMICEADLGCFQKGSQRALIERYDQQRLGLAKAKARSYAEDKANAKAKAEADAQSEARARAEASARAKVQAARAKAIKGPFSEMTWEEAVNYCRSNDARLPSMNELANIHRYECRGEGPESCRFWFWSAEQKSFKLTVLGATSTNMKLRSYVRCVQ